MYGLRYSGAAVLLLLGPLQATPRAGSEGDYSGYFDNILLVEDAISREDFPESLRLYSQTFREYDRVLARDAYNACQLAALTGDERFEAFFLQCARSGVPMRLLLGNAHIAPRYNADSLRLRSLFIEGRNHYLSRIDTALRNEFEVRFEREQKIKGKEGYREVCTDNFRRIAELAVQGRFPGEAVIGPDDNLGNDRVLPTLLHYPYSYTALEPALWKAVQMGNAHPLMIVYLYGFNQTRTSILYDKTVPPDTTHFAACYNFMFGKHSDDLAEVNRQRKLRKMFSTEVEKRLEAVAAKYRLDYRMGF